MTSATGERTREDIEVGLPFKGAGALHPSLPLLHLGPGDSGPDKETQYARAYLYSLTNQEKLLEYGGGPDPFAIRVFHGFDSSPLFDKKTDTPVSYTHLDVYKRQGNDSVHLGWKEGIHVKSANRDSVHIDKNGSRVFAVSYTHLNTLPPLLFPISSSPEGR